MKLKIKGNNIMLIKDKISIFKNTFGKYIDKYNIYFEDYSLLSSLYLCNCRKILRIYEKQLLNNYNKPKKDIGYDYDLDRAFCKLARINVIYYFNKIPNPIIILRLQGKYKKVCKVQKYCNKNNIYFKESPMFDKKGR